MAASIVVCADAELRTWTAFMCIIVVYLDKFWLERGRDNFRLLAAKIQEDFDCEFLRLSWNELLVGRRPTPEEIRNASMNTKSMSEDDAKNWYPPDIGSLPLDQARIVCQRVNISWDFNLRDRYRNCIIVALATTGVSVIIPAMVSGVIFKDFVLTIAVPLLPAFFWGIRELQQHKKALNILNRLVDFTTRMLDAIKQQRLEPNQADKSARQIQDCLFLLRSTNPLIPNWFYRREHTGLRTLMNGVIEDLARQENHASPK